MECVGSMRACRERTEVKKKCGRDSKYKQGENNVIENVFEERERNAVEKESCGHSFNN